MRAVVILGLVLGLYGCNQAMENQPRYEALEAAPDWEDNQSARRPVPGTVARDEPLTMPARSLPVPLDRELLEDGRRQYRIYCTPCHGLTGDGQGMIVQRGLPAPPSFHTERLRQVPLRHFYNVISEGYGVMYSYGARVTPENRWAVAAYIRALQLSQHGSPEDLTAQQQKRLAQGEASQSGTEGPE